MTKRIRLGVAALAAGAVAVGAALLAAPAAEASAPAVYAIGSGRALVTGLIDLTNAQAIAMATATVQSVTATTNGPTTNLLDGLSSFGPYAADLPLSVQLGVLGQWATASSDGSSQAFSGTASAAPGLVGVSLAGGSSAPAAVLAIGSSSTLQLTVRAGVAAGAARETKVGVPSGRYALGEVQLGLTTPLLSPGDPQIPTSLTVDVGSVLQAAGIDLDALPPNTDLIGLLTSGVVKSRFVTALTDAIVPDASGIPLLGAALGNVVGGLLAALSGLSGATSGLGAPFDLIVNQQTATVDGATVAVGGAGQASAPAGSAFTESALTVTAAAQSVQLGTASVGPNVAKASEGLSGGGAGGGSGDSGAGGGSGGTTGGGQGANDGTPDNTPIDLPISGQIVVDPGQAAQGLDPVGGSLPQIWGKLAVGATLTAKPGAWAKGARLSYRWFAGGAPIKLATRSSFKLTAAQLHKKISIQVTGKLSAYADTAYKSTTVAAVGLGRFAEARPSITGRALAGRVLTAHHARTAPAGKVVKVVYRWYLDGRKIAGATKSTLKLKSGWHGKRITVKSIATAPGYAKLVLASKATARISSLG